MWIVFKAMKQDKLPWEKGVIEKRSGQKQKHEAANMVIHYSASNSQTATHLCTDMHKMIGVVLSVSS